MHANQTLGTLKGMADFKTLVVLEEGCFGIFG